MRTQNIPPLVLAALLLFAAVAFAQNPNGQRVNRGLQVLYDFRGSGDAVRDVSGTGELLNLKIENLGAVQRSPGSLAVQNKTLIRSEQPARRLIDAVRRSGQLTIEAWVTPRSTSQNGPARIVTLSANTVQRNFTLGQENKRYDARFRASGTDANGLPSVSSRSGAVVTKPTHLVYTRESSGVTRLYVNGKESGKAKATGSLGNWDRSHRLALANELTGDRPWLGTYHLVAIFDRAHSAAEVQRQFKAGFDAAAAPRIANTTPAPKAEAAAGKPGQRISNGLQVLYDFAEQDGNLIRDRAGAGKPIDLKIADVKSIRRSPGRLEMIGKGTIARAGGNSSRLTEAVKRSGEITIEAWVRPANVSQDGPARIVTISKDHSNRNVTLGQDGDRYDIRFRASGTSGNGIPSTASPSKSLTAALTHVVYTRDRGGNTSIFLNGRRAEQGKAAGNTGNWDGSFTLALGDELSGGRRWLGIYHLVAIYNRDLSTAEITQNFKAGPDGSSAQAIAKTKDEIRDLRFVTQVSPLLSRRCLECHDTATKQGGFDLSRRASALAGGDSGKVLIAGKSSESLLWQSVEDDLMPHEREPLTADEKKLLREWIDDGVAWPLEFIDQAIYAHEGRSDEHWVQRLTVQEYIATVRAAVGVDIQSEAQKLLPPDTRADGFSNTAYNLNVDLQHVDAYAKLAEIIAERMDVVKFAGQFEKGRKLTDDNMRSLIAKMGKWLLRGPLDEEEVVLYRGISTTVASAGGSFEDAIHYVIQAMLQSPRFIYRMESQIGDGQAWPAEPYELAARMSYIVWGAPPDRQLLQAADRGDLSDSVRVASELKRMLGDPRAVSRSLDFISQWLDLARLDNLRPNEEKFPDWDRSIAADMRAETLAFFEEVVWRQRRPMSDLLNAKISFLTPRLAKHYGIKPAGDGLRRYKFQPADRRGGLLTQGSVLTVGGDEASMVTRGLLVLHELLRGVVKDPPPCVDTRPIASRPGLTQRMIAEQRISLEACGGCHAKFEPLAFGLERFDGLGSFHQKDEFGNQLREDGEVLIPGNAAPVKYQTSSELMDLLAGSDRVQESLTWKLTQFALGRPLLATDAPTVAEIHQNAQKNGGTYQAILSAIVLSDLVQMTRTESQ